MGRRIPSTRNGTALRIRCLAHSIAAFTQLSPPCPAAYDERMKDCNARDCDKWLMVDDNGQKTLFQLVEMGKGADAARLASEFPARAIVVDIALPALPALDEEPGRRPRSASSQLILLKVRTVTGDDANGGVRIARQRLKPVRMADTASPD
jgi:hypothetical protein